MSARTYGPHVARWVGSKLRFAARVAEVMPRVITSYAEPFVGSGSIALHLIETGRITPGARVTVCDTGPMRDVWRSFGKCGLVDEIREYDECRDVESAYRVAKMTVGPFANPGNPGVGVPAPERAAALLVLNQLAFNGLWRVNRQGEFNVPRDPSKHLNTTAIIERIERCARLVDRVDLRVVDDWRSPELWSRNEVIYVDPPYCGTFSSYDAAGFDADDHDTLATLATDAAVFREALVVVSNSDHELTRRLYPTETWRISYLRRPNNVTCDGSTRAEKVSELLMVSR